MAEQSVVIQRFEKLPKGVKFVRVLPGRDSEACIVECSHPMEHRKVFSAGPRAGLPLCGVCKGDDMARSCLTVARVPAEARSVAQREVQTTLF